MGGFSPLRSLIHPKCFSILRDIDELALKITGGLKASKEQKEKVEKKQGVEDDIAELEEAEDDLKNKEPPSIPAILLIEELESDIDIEGGGISSLTSTPSTKSIPPPLSSAVTNKISLPIPKPTNASNVEVGMSMMISLLLQNQYLTLTPL